MPIVNNQDMICLLKVDIKSNREMSDFVANFEQIYLFNLFLYYQLLAHQLGLFIDHMFDQKV